MKRYVSALAAIFMLGACSGDTGTGSSGSTNGEPWEFADAGADGANASQNSTNVTPNGTPNNGTPNGTPNNGTPNGTFNNGTPNNSGQSNNAAPVDMGTGGADAGTPCELNSSCADGLICCPGFDGAGTCEVNCLTGGLCGGDQTECGDNRECCDLSDIGGQPTCLSQCVDGGNNDQGAPCDTNPDCQDGEVCCVGFDGNGQCGSPDDCFTGGACAQTEDCLNDQECCDFNVTKVCLDQCNF